MASRLEPPCGTPQIRIERDPLASCHRLEDSHYRRITQSMRKRLQPGLSSRGMLVSYLAPGRASIARRIFQPFLAMRIIDRAEPSPIPTDVSNVVRGVRALFFVERQAAGDCVRIVLPLLKQRRQMPSNARFHASNVNQLEQRARSRLRLAVQREAFSARRRNVGIPLTNRKSPDTVPTRYI